MLSGQDEDENFLTKKHTKKRNKGLLDYTKLTEAERTEYEISGDDGGGESNPDTYRMKQYPFPIDSTIRRKKNVYITDDPVVE